MITLTTIQTVKKGQEARLEQLMQGLTNSVLANEAGCLLFQWARSKTDPSQYLVLEQYVDDDAVAQHMKTDYLQAFLPKMMECLEAEPHPQQFENIIPSAPRSAPFFHIGIVVKDLAAAIERYSQVLGVTFVEPATFHVPEFADPDPHPCDVVATYTSEGPPYYELIEASGDGLFSERNADQILYAGVWEPDVPARIESLKANGVGIDAVLKDSDGQPFVVISSAEGLGIRIEWVGTTARPLIERWEQTGKFTGQVAK